MYQKLCNSDFDVVGHLNANIEGETLESSFKVVHTTESIREKPSKKMKRKIESTHFRGVHFEDFVAISRLHEKYIAELKAEMSPDLFLSHLYKAELTGAQVEIRSKGIRRKGIVVEERANVLLVIHESGAIKMYPKAANNFLIDHDGVKYLFFGKRMRSGRFYKK